MRAWRNGRGEKLDNVESGKLLGRISPTPDPTVLLQLQSIGDGLQAGQAPSQNTVKEVVARTSARSGEGQERNIIINV